jgi:hypothetical protein
MTAARRPPLAVRTAAPLPPLSMFGRRRGSSIGEGGLCRCNNAGKNNSGKDRAKHPIFSRLGRSN